VISAPMYGTIDQFVEVTLSDAWGLTEGETKKKFLLFDQCQYDVNDWVDNHTPERCEVLNTVHVTKIPDRDPLRPRHCIAMGIVHEQVMIQHRCDIDVKEPRAHTHCMEVLVGGRRVFKHCPTNLKYEVYDRPSAYKAGFKRWPAKPVVSGVDDM
jgi:hypothetical protein